MGERTSGREHYVNLRIGGVSAVDRGSPSSISDASAIAFPHESALTGFRAWASACHSSDGDAAGACPATRSTGLSRKRPTGASGTARRLRLRSRQRAHGSDLDDKQRRSLDVPLHLPGRRGQHGQRLGDLEHARRAVRHLLHDEHREPWLHPGLSLLRAASVLALKWDQRERSGLEQPEQCQHDERLLRQLRAPDAEGGGLWRTGDRPCRARFVGLPRTARGGRVGGLLDRERQELGSSRRGGDRQHGARLCRRASAFAGQVRAQRPARDPRLALGQRHRHRHQHQHRRQREP